MCTKETNQKTRTAAYDLLSSLAQRLESACEAADPWAVKGGGVRSLFTMLLGGLASPEAHAVSATVMAMARVLYEFPEQLGEVAPKLLSPVLRLLQTKSREVVKAVMGFAKVCVSRLPKADLQAQLASLLPGLFSWSDDPKNRFRLKVRVVMERLVRRLGYEAVAEAVPPEHAKLLTHIRREEAKRERRRKEGWGGGGGDEEGWGGEGARSVRSRASRWNEDVFSDDGEGGGGEEADEDEGAGGRGRGRRAPPPAPSRSGPRSQRASGPPSRAVDLGEGDADPMDLLEGYRGRKAVRRPGGVGGGDDGDGGAGFGLSADGRLDFTGAGDGPREGKRKRGGGEEGDGGDGGAEEDVEDGRTHRSAKSRATTSGGRTSKGGGRGGGGQARPQDRPGGGALRSRVCLQEGGRGREAGVRGARAVRLLAARSWIPQHAEGQGGEGAGRAPDSDEAGGKGPGGAGRSP